MDVRWCQDLAHASRYPNSDHRLDTHATKQDSCVQLGRIDGSDLIRSLLKREATSTLTKALR